MDDDKPLLIIKHGETRKTSYKKWWLDFQGNGMLEYSYRITSELLVGCAGHLRSATLMAFRQRHVAHTEALHEAREMAGCS